MKELICNAIRKKIITESAVEGLANWKRITIGNDVWFLAEDQKSLPVAVDDYIAELFDDPENDSVYQRIIEILKTAVSTA